MKRNLIVHALLGMFCLAACKPRPSDASATLGTVQELTDAPPKTLYHFDELQFVQFGDRDGTLSPTEWSNVNSNNPSIYERYRLGLYGAQHLAYAERYGFGKFNDNLRAPWLVAFDLKDDCVDPRRVVNNLREVRRSLAYASWRTEHADREADLLRCAESFDAAVEQKKACDDVFSRFFEEAGVKVVHDDRWPGRGFWYVRSRDCISRVESSPERIVDVLVRTPDVFTNIPFVNGPDRGGNGFGGQAIFYVVVRSLAIQPKVAARALALEQPASDSDIPFVQHSFGRLFKTLKLCESRGSMPIFTALATNFAFFTGINVGSDGFQKVVDQFLTDADARCSGGGVPPVPLGASAGSESETIDSKGEKTETNSSNANAESTNRGNLPNETELNAVTEKDGMRCVQANGGWVISRAADGYTITKPSSQENCRLELYSFSNNLVCESRAGGFVLKVVANSADLSVGPHPFDVCMSEKNSIASNTFCRAKSGNTYSFAIVWEPSDRSEPTTLDICKWQQRSGRNNHYCRFQGETAGKFSVAYLNSGEDVNGTTYGDKARCESDL